MATRALTLAPEEAPLYPVVEAARFSRTDASTLRRWAEGYRVGRSRYPAMLVLPEERPLGEPALSFENLVEAALISHWRRRGVPLQRVRRAHAIGVKEFGEHPFVRQTVYVSGMDLFVEADESTKDEGGRTFTTLTQGGQRALAPAIEHYLETIDWRSGVGKPYQWRPPEGEDVVKLNPQIDFGLPAVRRIRTEIIKQRFMALETIDAIAADFRLKRSEVETALRYEWTLRASLPKAA